MVKVIKKAVNYAAKNPVNMGISIISILMLLFLPSRMAIFSVVSILCFCKAITAGKTPRRIVFIIFGTLTASCISPIFNLVFKIGLALLTIYMFFNIKKHRNVIYMSANSDS